MNLQLLLCLSIYVMLLSGCGTSNEPALMLVAGDAGECESCRFAEGDLLARDADLGILDSLDASLGRMIEADAGALGKGSWFWSFNCFVRSDSAYEPSTYLVEGLLEPTSGRARTLQVFAGAYYLYHNVKVMGGAVSYEPFWHYLTQWENERLFLADADSTQATPFLNTHPEAHGKPWRNAALHSQIKLARIFQLPSGASIFHFQFAVDCDERDATRVDWEDLFWNPQVGPVAVSMSKHEDGLQACWLCAEYPRLLEELRVGKREMVLPVGKPVK